MAILESLEEAFRLVIKNPKIVIPASIRWLASAVFVLYIVAFWRFLDQKLDIYYNLKNFAIFNDESFLNAIFSGFLSNFSYLLLFGAGLIFVSLIFLAADSFLNAFYTLIAFEYKSGKRFNVNNAAKYSLRLVWKLFSTMVLMAIAFIFSLGILFAISLFPFGILISILGFFAAIIFYALAVWVMPSVIVKKNTHGINAIKICLEFVYKNFFNLLGIFILFFALAYIVLASFIFIPFIGYFLYMIADLFVVAMDKSLQAIVFSNLQKRS